MCENKNAKQHRIRGWHIGLWQRKLVGVCHLGWALPISSARGGLFADKCSQPAVWFRLLRKTNRNTDRNANTQIYIYKFTYIHKSHQGGQGTVICSDKWLNWPQPPMSVPWLHKQNCDKNVTCRVVQKHLPVKVIHVVNITLSRILLNFPQKCLLTNVHVSKRCQHSCEKMPFWVAGPLWKKQQETCHNSSTLVDPGDFYFGRQAFFPLSWGT